MNLQNLKDLFFFCYFLSLNNKIILHLTMDINNLKLADTSFKNYLFHYIMEKINYYLKMLKKDYLNHIQNFEQIQNIY